MKSYKVKNFTYNGFFGKTEEGFTEYTAIFKEWTKDPGIAIFSCSDGKERMIPTFAIEEIITEELPKQPKTGVLCGQKFKFLDIDEMKKMDWA